MQTLEYSPSAGTHIGYACKEAVAMAMNQQAKVKFSFNGIELEATPESSPPALESAWSAKQEQASKEYRESPKGIAAAKKRTEEIIRKQRSLNTSLEVLSDIIADHDKLMIWLKGVAEDADDIGVQFSKDRLAAQLEAAGFVENEHVGEKPEWFNSRPRMAHYIVGQALNCLRRGMGPHPVTGSFVDRYFALPKVEDSSPNM
jgi:hypothetical protein